MARLLSIAPLFLAPPRCSLAYWVAVLRAICLYVFYAIVIFVCVFPWPGYGTVYENYWHFLDRSLVIGLVFVLGTSWFLTISMAIFLPYPEVKSREQIITEKLKKINKSKKKNKEKIPVDQEEPAQDSSETSSEIDLERGELAGEVASKHVDPKECAVIIPTHNSAMVITETIQAAARYVPYKNIFIMDNGPKRTEANLLTEKVVREISRDINYFFFPIPSKAVNLYLGSVVASAFQYLFVLDDDTIFPEGFCWPSLPKGKTTASGFSICAVNSQRNRNGLIVKLQDWEYKIAGYRKYVQAKTSSTFFHHGAIGFWKREAYQETWKRHYALPLGDDRLSGMQNLFLGNRMSYVASQTPFQTIVPEQYIWANKGTFWTLFKQRAFRWNVTNFRHLWMDVWLFFTYIPRKSTVMRTIFGSIAFRVFLILELASLYVTINMPVAWIFLLHYRWKWWLIIHSVLFVSAILQGLFSNYIILRKRKDLRVEWYILFITPVYRFTLRWFRLLGIVASALVYIPLYPHPQKVSERPEVRAVLKALEITGERVQATLPEEMDKYAEAELRLRVEAREALNELKKEFDMEDGSDSESLPPIARASGKTAEVPEIIYDVEGGSSESNEDQDEEIEDVLPSATVERLPIARSNPRLFQSNSKHKLNSSTDRLSLTRSAARIGQSNSTNRIPAGSEIEMVPLGRSSSKLSRTNTSLNSSR